MLYRNACAVVVMLGVIVFAACGRGDNGVDEHRSAYVRLPRAVVTPEFIATYGFNVDHVRSEHFVFGYMTPDALQRLSPTERADMIELSGSEWSKVDFDPDTLQVREVAGDQNGQVAEDYHNYEQLTAELHGLASAHPDLLSVASAGKSVQGRELWYVKISDHVTTDEAEPKLLYIANMHGDETVGRELMVYLIRELVAAYGTDARITNLVDHAQIFIMPSMNPDGFERDARENARGVDLNRAFPDIDRDRTDSPSGRAPEVQAIMSLHAQHHFLLALNFHGGAVCFNLPWDTRSNRNAATRFADDTLLYALGREYADANERMRRSSGGSFDRGVTYGYEWYEVNGGMQDWSIFWRRSIHATVELSSIKHPSASSLTTYWQENRESLLRYLEQGRRGLHLNAVDPAGNPLNTPVTMTQGRRSITYDDGRIHRPTLDGMQQLTLSAPGFQNVTIELPAEYFGGNPTDVILPAAR